MFRSPEDGSNENLSTRTRDASLASGCARLELPRVVARGHSVPEVDVRRRYHRGLTLFEHVYKPLVDEWYHWFSDEGGLRLGQHAER